MRSRTGKLFKNARQCTKDEYHKYFTIFLGFCLQVPQAENCTLNSRSHLQLLSQRGSILINTGSEIFVSLLPFDSSRMKLLIACLILGFVQIEAFRVPLHYGTGVHENGIPNKGIVDQAIFNRLWSAIEPFNVAPIKKVQRLDE